MRSAVTCVVASPRGALLITGFLAPKVGAIIPATLLGFAMGLVVAMKRRLEERVLGVYSEDVTARIESRLEPEGDCLIWQGARSNAGTRTGYGSIKVGGKTKRVTRVIMENELGRELSAKEYVLHSCDNPPCCNVAHLSIGDQTVNMREMRNRGRERRPRGPEHSSSKLTESDVRAIRQEYTPGVNHLDRGNAVELAQRFGVSYSTVKNVLRRSCWDWVS